MYFFFGNRFVFNGSGNKKFTFINRYGLIPVSMLNLPLPPGIVRLPLNYGYATQIRLSVLLLFTCWPFNFANDGIAVVTEQAEFFR